MNPIVKDLLNKRFPNVCTAMTQNGIEIVVFKAKNPAFGDVEIYEESPGSYTLILGHFTHTHTELITDTHDDVTLGTFIAGFLDDLFNDKIVCYGTHETGGGYDYVRYFREEEDTAYFTWSGKYHINRKPLIQYKHWYTEPHDYADTRANHNDTFWLNEKDEIVINVARVYALDERACTAQQKKRISAIIMESTASDVKKPNYFLFDAATTETLWYSFEPVGIQIGGRLTLSVFERWEYVWHNLLELAAFPYKYEDNPDFT